MGEVVIEATSPSRTDLLILPDEGVLLLSDAESDSIEAFYVATGAPLGAWAMGVPSSVDARMALGPCPAP